MYIPNIFVDMNFDFRAPIIGTLFSVAKLGIVEAQSFRPRYFCYGYSTILDNVTPIKLGLLTHSSVKLVMIQERLLVDTGCLDTKPSFRSP